MTVHSFIYQRIKLPPGILKSTFWILKYFLYIFFYFIFTTNSWGFCVCFLTTQWGGKRLWFLHDSLRKRDSQTQRFLFPRVTAPSACSLRAGRPRPLPSLLLPAQCAAGSWGKVVVRGPGTGLTGGTITVSDCQEEIKQIWNYKHCIK